MARLVQKYGGTSVKNIDCIKNVAQRIKESYDSGNELIVVVSARAGVTDKLINDAKKISNVPNQRELDVLLCVGEQETVALLAIALNKIGVKAVSKLAFQVGIHTCDSHGSARIIDIDGGDIEHLLSEKNVVIVAGYQGITYDNQLTTLGRGGSDLTALALAHRFHADRCEIFTDVDGVFTGDPNIIEQAQFIPSIDFESLLRLSFFDNKVMQDCAVAFAQKNDVNFFIRNTFKSLPGTYVSKSLENYESCVLGITSKKDLCLLSCEFNEDVMCDVLNFFRGNSISICFVKHRKIDKILFFDEICLNQSDFDTFGESFLLKFSDACLSYKLLSKLCRIDIVGTNIISNKNIFAVFDKLSQKELIRSEYGKHGLSFLLKTSNYASILNMVHNTIFMNSTTKEPTNLQLTTNSN